jgi:hypothetical protein
MLATKFLRLHAPNGLAVSNDYRETASSSLYGRKLAKSPLRHGTCIGGPPDNNRSCFGKAQTLSRQLFATFIRDGH